MFQIRRQASRFRINHGVHFRLPQLWATQLSPRYPESIILLHKPWKMSEASQFSCRRPVGGVVGRRADVPSMIVRLVFLGKDIPEDAVESAGGHDMQVGIPPCT